MHKITAADINSRLNNYIQKRSEHVDLQVALHLIDADSILVTRTIDEKVIRVIRITALKNIDKGGHTSFLSYFSHVRRQMYSHIP